MSSLTAVYLPKVGKCEPKSCRASGFLTSATNTRLDHPKPLADMIAQKYMGIAGHHFGTHWIYNGIQTISDREYLYYSSGVSDGKVGDHVWLSVDLT